MNVAILGCGKRGLFIKKIIDDYYSKKIRVSYFCDNDVKDNLLEVDGIKVININEMSERYKNKEIDLIILATSPIHFNNIRQQLKDMNIEEIFTFSNYIYEDGSFINRGDMNLLIKIEECLSYLEISICDHCNLNCSGCTHYSCLIHGEQFADYDKYVMDIKRLKEIYKNIDVIRLLGGEPLLNKELYKFLESARKEFPEAIINIVTNGLLIKKMNDILINSIKENNACIQISLYNPTYKIKNEISEFLEKKNIKYEFGPKIESFMKFINLKGDSNKEEIFNNCPNKACTFMKDGYIASCCMPLLIDYFNNYFNTNIPSNNSKINIYDENLNKSKLNKLLNTPMEICKYCSYPQNFKWTISSKMKSINDWCID